MYMLCIATPLQQALTIAHAAKSNSLGVQAPAGVDQAPLVVSHTANGEPVVSPEHVALHCVWLVQPADGQVAPSGVVEGTPVHGTTAARKQQMHSRQ
jgi:hypothetical protein